MANRIGPLRTKLVDVYLQAFNDRPKPPPAATSIPAHCRVRTDVIDAAGDCIDDDTHTAIVVGMADPANVIHAGQFVGLLAGLRLVEVEPRRGPEPGTRVEQRAVIWSLASSAGAHGIKTSKLINAYLTASNVGCCLTSIRSDGMKF